MRKVMLVIDEYSEMVGLESFLRRLGFDVLSLAKETQVPDALLSFQPDIVIASFKGRNVDGLKLAHRMKKTMTPPPRVALAYRGVMPQVPAENQKSIEALVELPVEARSAIQMLAQLSGLSAEPILEKYAKMSSAVLTTDEQIVIITDNSNRSPKASAIATSQAAQATTERTSRYDRYLAEHASDRVDKVLPHDKAAKAMAKLKKDSESEKENLDRIQAEKQQFAKALFREGRDKKK